MKKSLRFLILFTLILFLSNSVKSTASIVARPFRGFMIDAPRGVESIDYYFRLIDFCKSEGINSIIFRLTDDQGTAYLFTSHPELNRCEGAFTTQELRKIVQYAQQRGIEMIPEIESFGHSKYITQTKQYSFLNDGPAGADFNALCPVSDSTFVLMNDLFTEVATIFPGPYFHLGCDEVNWGAGKLSKDALSTKSKSQIWAEYVNKLNGCLKALNKKTMIWGDVPIYQDKAVLDLLSKDVVLIDWNYWETDKEKVNTVAQTLLGKGFQIIGCPAVSWCRWGPRVGESQFKNINAYAAVYGNLENPNNLGIILSNWVPKRYLQNSQWDTYTIAAKIMIHKGNYNFMDAIPAFVENHFGVKYNSSWEKIYSTIYKDISQWECSQNDSLKFSPWYAESHIRKIVMNHKVVKNNMPELKKLLLSCKHDITRNKGDFDEFLLTIDFIDYNYNRQNELIAFINSKKTDLNSVGNYLKKLALADQLMLEKIHTVWRIGRRCTIRERDGENMWSYFKVANYSKHLSENPAEFIDILNALSINIK